jgi:hypothetical protein
MSALRVNPSLRQSERTPELIIAVFTFDARDTLVFKVTNHTFYSQNILMAWHVRGWYSAPQLHPGNFYVRYCRK